MRPALHHRFLSDRGSPDWFLTAKQENRKDTAFANSQVRRHYSGLLFFSLLLDHETAASAVRNLNNVDVGGRPLRIDLADSDPFLEGKTTVRGELVDGGEPGPNERLGRGGKRDEMEVFMASLPPGIKVPPGTSPMDTISHTLGTMNPSRLTEVLAQMKVRSPLCDATILSLLTPQPRRL